MKISFIVSTYERPKVLRCLLSCLDVQTEQDFEVIVTDNSIHSELAKENAFVTEQFGEKFRYLRTHRHECYSSAEDGVRIARSDWLCFPSDDNWYCSLFAETMLRHARENNLGLVYCDCLYGRPTELPRLFIASPRVNQIDKGGFLCRREIFKEFPGKARISCSDGYLIEELVQAGHKHGKAPGVLWCHQ